MAAGRSFALLGSTFRLLLLLYAHGEMYGPRSGTSSISSPIMYVPVNKALLMYITPQESQNSG